MGLIKIKSLPKFIKTILGVYNEELFDNTFITSVFNNDVERTEPNSKPYCRCRG